MTSMDMFCERCGATQPTASTRDERSGGALARRIFSAVSGQTPDGGSAAHSEPFLALCLECRGYTCPACWNDDAGTCQTCNRLPAPVSAPEPQPEPAFVAERAPEPERASAEPAPEPEPALVAEPEPELQPASPAQLEPDRVDEPAPEVVTEPEPEPVRVGG